MSSQKKAQNDLQNMFNKLDVDLTGVINLKSVKEKRLVETARKLLPTAKSIVVLGMEVYSEVLDLTSPGRAAGSVSMNDLNDRHSEYLASRLTKAAYDVAKASRSTGYKALPLPSAGCPQDTRFLEAALSYKHAAEAAGMGAFGWHTLIVTPQFGPRVRFACCLTEAELEGTAKVKSTVNCSECGLCIKNCPAGAIAKPKAGIPYSFNKFACSAFRNNGGGCSECMRICPAGR